MEESVNRAGEFKITYPSLLVSSIPRPQVTCKCCSTETHDYYQSKRFIYPTVNGKRVKRLADVYLCKWCYEQQQAEKQWYENWPDKVRRGESNWRIEVC